MRVRALEQQPHARPRRADSPQTMASPIKRRQFLKSAAVMGGSALLLPHFKLFGAEAPSHKLNLALIATGHRAQDHFAGAAREKGIYLKLNYVNSDPMHALVDLPTRLSIEQTMQLFKGASSHWINQSRLLPGKFAWGRGYGVFSVSHSAVAAVGGYISGQEEHHRRRSFSEELQRLVERYGLEWRKDETVETVSSVSAVQAPR